MIPPLELENNLFLWLATVNQYKIRDTFCSYSVMELCTKGLGNQVEVLKVRSQRSQQVTVLRALTTWPGLEKAGAGGGRHAWLPSIGEFNLLFLI